MRYIVITTQVKGGFVATAVQINDENLLVQVIGVSPIKPSRNQARIELNYMMGGDGHERVPAHGEWRIE